MKCLHIKIYTYIKVLLSNEDTGTTCDNVTDIHETWGTIFEQYNWQGFRVCVSPGESALHLAIVYGDLEMVKYLVENGAHVNQRATGRFFLPEDQKTGATDLTNYEGVWGAQAPVPGIELVHCII